jgi:hypothetical protein
VAVGDGHGDEDLVAVGGDVDHVGAATVGVALPGPVEYLVAVLARW